MSGDYRTRTLEQHWRSASSQFPVLLLTGPRQVGKTTVLRHLSDDRRAYVTLDDPGLRALARTDPALFLQRFKPPVLIDEVQYAPELFPHIKMLVDRQPAAGDFWLTGSQQFRMMQNVAETMAGRVAVVQMLGFSLRERDGRDGAVGPFMPTPEELTRRSASGVALDLASVFETIWTGSMPVLATGAVTRPDLYYASYVQTYLERDVRDLTQVGDLETFLRFLRAAAARTGQVLNLSNLARAAGVSVPTARSWMSILEASYQVLLLRPWHSNLTKRLTRRPVLYFLDTGLCSWLTNWTSPATLATGAMSGAIFETWVIGEILRSWWHRLREAPLWFYRDRDGREIDLLLTMDQRLHPVEIKLGASPRDTWSRHFRALDSLALERGPGAIVCLAEHQAPHVRGVEIVPAGLL